MLRDERLFLLKGYGTTRKRFGTSPGLALAITLTRSAGSERADAAEPREAHGPLVEPFKRHALTPPWGASLRLVASMPWRQPAEGACKEHSPPLSA